jgi:alkylation response protein AidB-like acyl-CoA dehydrogenase
MASLFDGPRIATPLYRFPVFGLLALAIAAVASGIACEALALFIAQASHSVPQAGARPLAAKATVQEAVARAEAALQSARAYLLASVNTAWEAAQDPGAAADGAGASLPVACRRDLRLASTHAVQTAAEVVTRLYTLAGGSAVFAASPLQRALRDVHVATQHMMVNDATYELTGRLLLGVPTQVSML